MPTVKNHPDTSIDEIADGVYRINTSLGGVTPEGFSFNRYLVVDDAPLLFHAGLRGHFEKTRAAIETIMPVKRLRYVAFSHFEADECGALNDLLAVAPEAEPVCSAVGAMVSVGDIAIRPPHPLTDGQDLSLGKRNMRWFDTPHLPHGWDCGYMMETTARTFFCGDLFTQPGDHTPALTEGDILGPSEAMRAGLDYFAHGRDTRPLLEKLASQNPKTLACMHGSAWRGDGAALLRELATRL